MPDAVREAIDRAHREHWGRLLALLTRAFRSLDIAEDALADAFAAAVDHWPGSGVPDRSDAWLMTVAKRRGTDRLRREATLARKLPLLVIAGEPAEPAADVPDERLSLIFTCCHPALAPDARVALTLRCVGGLRTPEVARAFLVSESTMAARITRAKKKIAQAAIPYRVPDESELPDRLSGVLAVLYLIFTEGYSATRGDQLIRRELAAEAIRLLRIVADLLPDQTEPRGLLALMLLQHSRRDARTDAAGRLVLLADQDRSLWRAAEISEGLALVPPPGSGPYALQAAIAAEHAKAGRASDTDWPRIAELYLALERATRSPVVRLNRAVAVAESDGPEAGLAMLSGLDEQLPRFHRLPAARADLLRRLGRFVEAAEQYQLALKYATVEPERRFLRERRDECARRS